MIPNIRRKVALWVCPELTELPSEMMHKERRPVHPDWEKDALQIRRLDYAYAAYTGAKLTMKNGPAYSGPMYRWASYRFVIRRNALSAILRLRTGETKAPRPTTAYIVLNYFSAIWPADLEWPTDIPRPEIKKGDAA